MSRPTDAEMNEQVNEAIETMDSGSRYPGMNYEAGVYAALNWVLGDSETPPMED